MTNNINRFLQERFPANALLGGSNNESANPAIQLYGRRFYKDQTPVEYLAELLLVFSSPKTPKGEASSECQNANSFSLDGISEPVYWPKDRVALKLFSFFPSSKLETRHPIHHKSYSEALEQIKGRIDGAPNDKEDSIRLLQSLFSGFTGVAKNRTWVTHSFLPASDKFLSREVVWKHTKEQFNDWSASVRNFSTDGHRFMARGGELLFLQLALLFTHQSENETVLAKLHDAKGYEHLANISLKDLQKSLESGLSDLLSGSATKVDALADFVEKSLSDITINDDPKHATLGWVPRAAVPEAYLFAIELNNICRSSLSGLDKLEMLQILCCLQVLRSLCFQAQRICCSEGTTEGFIGNYAWVTADPDAPRGSATRKLAQTSLDSVEGFLYRVLRIVFDATDAQEKELKQADEHGFKIFRKIGKEIGLIIPKTGQGQRFVLPPSLLRVLVASTIAPGERVRLNEFYRRVFAHFGIALADLQLSVAIAWSSEKSGGKDYATNAESAWIEEALKQGGFLVELSDAVSIVHNPGSKE